MYTNWEELKKAATTCTNCELCKTRKNVVFGTGNPETKVLFIGEGPGENEDISGEPFVGRAGKLLDKMLAAIDLSRNDNIYIANIVKCRPPLNRDPLPKEQEACENWLKNQILIIKPKIIVCLGRIAASKLIKPDIKIMKEHGLVFKKGNYLMMPMLHPAAILRNPHLKPEAFEDFLKLRDLLAHKS